MKLLKWIWELVNELAKGLTQSGYVEVLPEDDDDAHREKYFEQVRQELENK